MEVMGQNKKELPNSTIILVLGILALVFCWCYGIVGLILGIIAVALAGTARRMYATSPEEYTEGSYRNVNAGRICGIIAICLSVLVCIFVLLIIFGALAIGLGAASCGL